MLELSQKIIIQIILISMKNNLLNILNEEKKGLKNRNSMIVSRYNGEICRQAGFNALQLNETNPAKRQLQQT